MREVFIEGCGVRPGKIGFVSPYKVTNGSEIYFFEECGNLLQKMDLGQLTKFQWEAGQYFFMIF